MLEAESGNVELRGSRKARFRARGRMLAVSVGVLAIAATTAIVGFGAPAGATDTSAARSGTTGGAAHSFPGLTTEQQTCLKNALGDVKLPSQGQLKDWVDKLKDVAKTCGVTVPSGSSSGGGSGFPGLTTEQQTCLKNALGDVKLPGAGSGSAVPSQDQVKSWVNKLKDAAKKCGVTLPTGDGSGRGSGFPGLTTEQQTCLKNALGDTKLPGAGGAASAPSQDQVKDWINKLTGALKTCGVTAPAGDSGMI